MKMAPDGANRAHHVPYIISGRLPIRGPLFRHPDGRIDAGVPQQLDLWNNQNYLCCVFHSEILWHLKEIEP